MHYYYIGCIVASGDYYEKYLYINDYTGIIDIAVVLLRRICEICYNRSVSVNRFDNIYVLNLISSKLNSGVKYLRGEHAKGEEEKETIVASRFKIEEQEQIKLF